MLWSRNRKEQSTRRQCVYPRSHSVARSPGHPVTRSPGRIGKDKPHPHPSFSLFTCLHQLVDAVHVLTPTHLTRRVEQKMAKVISAIAHRVNA